MMANQLHAMPTTLALSDVELAALTTAIRRLIDEARFPRAPIASIESPTCSNRALAGYPAVKMSKVPESRCSLASPSGSITWPSTTIGLFQCPGRPGSLATGLGESGR